VTASTKITLALFMTLASTLPAATINVLNVDSARFQSVNLNVNGSNGSHSAGVIRISYDGSPAFDVFCVDLFTSISYGVYDSYTIAPRPARYEDRAAWLYQNLYNPSTINTTALGAAFQVAIWDIVHDGGDGPTAGAIRSNSNTGSAIVNAWQSYLTASTGMSSYGVNIFINSRSNQPAQTLMGGLREAENPEPGTLVMMSAGLALIAFRFRRKI
jgi:hypothetical protein